MKLKTLAVASAVALSAGAASAATYDYQNSEMNLGGPALSCDVEGLLNSGCDVTFNEAGLGIDGYGVGPIPDTRPDAIDGFPLASGESLTLDFGVDTVWNSISLRLWNAVDDLMLEWDGGSLVWGPNAASTIDLGGVVSKSLTVSAYGELPACFLFCPAPDGFGNDNFTVASIDVSAVPVPASMPLILAGLGMLGWASKKRKSA